MINPLAQELNDALKGTAAETLFSDLGRRIYFPKGIIAQGGEAKKDAHLANGTIGITVIDGKPAVLPSVQKWTPEFTGRELASYAPTAGLPEIRNAWKEMQIKKNPLLAEKKTSLPAVVPGITAGLSYAMDLFVDEKKPLLAPNPSWDNYILIAETRRGADFHQFSMFKDGKFNLSGMEKAVKAEAEKYGSVRLILNFPQNPSGYSPTSKEVDEICRILESVANDGKKVLAIIDDAYFGLNYEKEIEPESIFAHIADLHENILAVKADGPTKEDFAWGLRCGFLTFGCKGFTDAQYEALVKKLMGVIRSSVSCASTPSQTILLKSFLEKENAAEKKAFKDVLEARYRKVRAFVDSHNSDAIEPLPFNSGYFMSFAMKGINAEKLRVKLLKEEGIGTIQIDDSTLRVAFSSIEEDKIDLVYSKIYKAAEELKRG